VDTSEWIRLITIPFFTGAIGWLINWTGLIMLFHPVSFYGVRVPGLRDVATLIPRRLQEIPGWMEGRVGWQGIVPARAAKMGSIAVDKAIAKLGTPAEFYQQLEPDEIAHKIVEMFGPEVPRIVDDTMWREQPQLWRAVPPRAKQAVYDRVNAQLPTIVKQITDEIGEHINLLLDPKLMVIDHFAANPALVNRIFQDVGKRELSLMVNFGFLFGFLFGIPVAAIIHFFPEWWLLPILGVFVGWMTNALGMFVIFEPVEPSYLLGVKLQGLFLRRQQQVADVYAGIIADDVVTLENIGNFLMTGPNADRTRQMLESAMGPAIDLAEYEVIRNSVAHEAVDYTMTPFLDPDFSRAQSDRIRSLIAARTREMDPKDFVEMLRSAIKEDEWMLYLHGALMGLAGGFIHLAIFGA
jgi:uncharacterized membrane protein YheB (UPF0754 family)